MAIQLAVEYLGVHVASAYIKVASVAIYEGKAEVAINIWYCASAGVAPFKEGRQVVPYVLEGDNPFKQAYEYLKTQPEFEGGTDC
ncbi:hypothetical protein D3C84_353710 [compost metagenome]